MHIASCIIPVSKTSVLIAKQRQGYFQPTLMVTSRYGSVACSTGNPATIVRLLGLSSNSRCVHDRPKAHCFQHDFHQRPCAMYVPLVLTALIFLPGCVLARTNFGNAATVISLHRCDMILACITSFNSRWLRNRRRNVEEF